MSSRSLRSAKLSLGIAVSEPKVGLDPALILGSDEMVLVRIISRCRPLISRIALDAPFIRIDLRERRYAPLIALPAPFSQVLKALETHYLARSLRVLPAVACLSRGWADAVSEFVNDVPNTGEGISPSELRRIKRAARDLDISFLAPDFMREGIALLGHFDMTDYVDEEDVEESSHSKFGRVLHGMALAFKRHFDLDDIDIDEALKQLFSSVACAYKKFLVVKTVEAKAKMCASNGSSKLWLEKCMVSKIVE